MLALLVAWCRRLDLAEEGLADAFEAAVRTWPARGVPANPAAWMLTAARRKITDRLRSEEVLVRRMPLLVVDAELTAASRQATVAPTGVLPDERLRLVLLCAHPRLARESAAALTLRLVLGVSTRDLAHLFLVPEGTMAARLTRARRRLAGATFEVPEAEELPGQISLVAQVAYLAFTAGYAPGSGPDVLRAETAGEAIRLVRVLRSLIPAPEAELDALLALMLLQHSRRAARVRGGALVLLAEQDRALWRHDEIAEALELLAPLTSAPPAPYLLQALIAAEHAIASTAAATDWRRIVDRYDELLQLADNPVVRLNRAIAVGEAYGSDAGLAALEGVVLPGHRLPAARAELLARSGKTEDAVRAFDAAISLCRNEAERAHLEGRRARVGAGSENTIYE